MNYFCFCFHRLRSASWPRQPCLQTMWVELSFICLMYVDSCLLVFVSYKMLWMLSFIYFCPVLTVWKPKMLNVSQLGSNLHVVFDHAPPTFGFTTYFLYYKLRQESHFKLKRCKPVSTLHLRLSKSKDCVICTYCGLSGFPLRSQYSDCIGWCHNETQKASQWRITRWECCSVTSC